MPTDLNQLLNIVREHGELAYSFVFIWAMGNSLILVLLAGFAAHLGGFDWGKLVMVCWIGSFAGDAVRFFIGRRFGSKWLSWFPRIERALQMTTRLVEHHYSWFVFLYRYPNGIRSLAGFAFGISSIPTRTFLLLNFGAAGLWSSATVSAGYAFGQVSEDVMSDTSSGLGFVMLLAFLGLSWMLSKKLERVAERA